MEKNVASQKVACFAWNNAAGAAKTGDAANISAQISIDGGTTAATNDVNPTELDATDAPGVYLFDTTQAETNGDLIIISPVSSTADIDIRPVFIYTMVTDAIVSAIATLQSDSDINTGTAGVLVDNAAISSATFATAAITAGAIAADAIGGSELNDNTKGSIKKNAALSNFTFLMVSDLNGVPKTGLTVTGTRSIDAAAFGAVSGAIAEVGNGIYQFDAAAGDTNGDFVTWRFVATDADDVFVSFKTVT